MDWITEVVDVYKPHHNTYHRDDLQCVCACVCV